jgi:four helix bundle protein
MDEARFKLEDFELYQIAREFRRRVYRLIKVLPPEEKYALASQMRGAALSVSNNVAEGHGRWHYREDIQYCRMARGSTEELIDDFNVCLDERYAETAILEEMKTDAYNLIRRINGYIAYLRKMKQGDEP